MTHTWAVDRALAVISLKRQLAYKAHWVFAVVLGGGAMLADLALWSNLLGDGTLGGYDWDSMRAYIVIGFFTATLAFGGADWRIADRILDGLIAAEAAWVVVLWFVGRLIFNRAVKKVTVHGG